MAPIESNEIPFEVIQDVDAGPRTGIAIEIYAHDDPAGMPLDVLPRRRDPRFLNEVARVGGGSFNISMEDKKILQNTSLLDEMNIVKCRLDGEIRSAFVIQGRGDVWVDRGEHRAREHKIAGEGLKTWLKKATVKPYGGLKPKSANERVFSFASEQGSWYNPAHWVAPVQVAQYNMDPPPGNTSPWGTAPAEWPDAPNAYWIWNSTSATPGVGYAYFRYEFDIAPEIGTANYSIFAAADDEFDLFVDAGRVMEVRDADSYAKTNRADFELDPGHHIIAARVRNLKGRGGFIASFFRAGDATADPPTAAVLLKVTNNTGWKINAYPTTPPGWTPGEIMLTLLAEAQARDVRFADTLVPTFTATHDSDGAAWERSLDWSFDIGSTYFSVVEKLEELVCDIWINPANYELNMSAQQGTRRDEQSESGEPVIFQEGRNLIRASEQSEADLVNALDMQTADGYMSFTDAVSDSIEKYGRLEGYVAGNSSAEVAGDVARSVFDRYAEPLRAAVFEITDVDRARPYKDFFEGDWTLALGRNGLEPRRVMSISITESDKTREAKFALEFDTITEDKVQKLERWLSRTSDGTLGGSVSNSGGGKGTPIAGGGKAGSKGLDGVGEAGPAGMVWKGDWSGAIDYSENDGVFYDGSSWIATSDNEGSAPSEANPNWDIMARKGSASASDVATMLIGPGAARDALEDVTGGFRSAAPTSGTWAVSDKVWNTLPSPGEFVGWICVTAGTPGTWKGFGLIES